MARVNGDGAFGPDGVDTDVSIPNFSTSVPMDDTPPITVWSGSCTFGESSTRP